MRTISSAAFLSVFCAFLDIFIANFFIIITFNQSVMVMNNENNQARPRDEGNYYFNLSGLRPKSIHPHYNVFILRVFELAD